MKVMNSNNFSNKNCFNKVYFNLNEFIILKLEKTSKHIIKRGQFLKYSGKK